MTRTSVDTAATRSTAARRASCGSASAARRDTTTARRPRRGRTGRRSSRCRRRRRRPRGRRRRVEEGIEEERCGHAGMNRLRSVVAHQNCRQAGREGGQCGGGQVGGGGGAHRHEYSSSFLSGGLETPYTAAPSIAVGTAARARCARQPAVPAACAPHTHAATPGCRHTAANPACRGRSSRLGPTFPTCSRGGGRCRGPVAVCGRARALPSPAMRWSNGACPPGPSRAPCAELCRPPPTPEPPLLAALFRGLRSCRRSSAPLRRLRLASGGGLSPGGGKSSLTRSTGTCISYLSQESALNAAIWRARCEELP